MTTKLTVLCDRCGREFTQWEKESCSIHLHSPFDQSPQHLDLCSRCLEALKHWLLIGAPGSDEE